MKLFIEQCVNGTATIVAEYIDNPQGAIVRYHQVCANLWNSADVYTGMVKIFNEALDVYEGRQEYITHPQPEPEPTPEPEEE